MLDFINFEILDKTKPFATDVLIQFEETGVNTGKYSFIQDRLDNYNLYMDTKYSMTYETQYNEPDVAAVDTLNEFALILTVLAETPLLYMPYVTPDVAVL